MNDILARFAAVDSLGVLMLVGGLGMLWMVWRVLRDDLDFTDRGPEESSPRPADTDRAADPPEDRRAA